MAKPVAIQPPLPNPTGNTTNQNLASFDQDLVRALLNYLGGVALRLNQTLVTDGSEVLRAPLQMQSVSVADLPSAQPGATAFAADGRKAGEGAGSGTGVLVFYDGTDWIAVDSGSAVEA